MIATVYHATYEVKWEPPSDFGLFNTVAKAKEACQKQTGQPLTWTYVPAEKGLHSGYWMSQPDQFEEYYQVTRRKVL